jgi:hypothetical protein
MMTTKTALAESTAEIKAELATLSADTASLLLLAHQQLQAIDAVIAKIERVTMPTDCTIDLAAASLRELVDQVIAARGHRGAAYLRTRLNQRLEGRTGRRQRSGGQDRIVTNHHAGNGVTSHL